MSSKNLEILLLTMTFSNFRKKQIASLELYHWWLQSYSIEHFRLFFLISFFFAWIPICEQAGLMPLK